MSPLKIGLVTVLAGGISIGAAIFGQRWLGSNPMVDGLVERNAGLLQTLPDFRLRDAEGRELASSAWAGKVLVLHFWATWCPDCLRELPAFVRTQEQLQGTGVQVVGIALDRAEDLTAFLKTNAVNFPVLIADPDAMAMAKRLGDRVMAIPFTAVFDRRGQCTFRHLGELSAAELEARIAPLTAAPGA